MGAMLGERSTFIMTRREFLTRISAVGVVGMSSLSAFSYARYIEPEWLELSKLEIPLKNTKISSKIRILHLSDFHYLPSVSLSFIEEAIAFGISQGPDLICLTGDFITTVATDFENYKKILRLLPKRAPTYACLGNHDGGLWAKKHFGLRDNSAIKKLLFETGICCLHNQSCKISIRNQELTLIGLGDYWSLESEPDLAFKKVSKEVATPKVLLSHNPDSKEILGNYNWDLMLCGHTHGGQLVIPFLGTPFAPVKDQRFVSGLNPWKGRWIYTTRGVGNLHGMRINCRPEVSVLDLCGV